MLPKALKCRLHQQQAAAGQDQVTGFPAAFVPERQRPGRAETQRGNQGRLAQFRFVVGMPADKIIAVAVTINQHRIKSISQPAFHVGANRQQPCRPGPRHQQIIAVAVANTRIGMPGLQTRQYKLPAGKRITVVGPVVLLQKIVQKPTACFGIVKIFD